MWNSCDQSCYQRAFGIIERGVPQAYVRARASSETLRSVHVLRVLLCIFYIKMGIWYVSKRAWIHVWYVSKPVHPCDGTPPYDDFWALLRRCPGTFSCTVPSYETGNSRWILTWEPSQQSNRLKALLREFFARVRFCCLLLSRPALSGGMDWWRMEWPFSRVQKIFFRGRNFQENAWNSAERAIFAKFQAPIFEIQSPKKCNSIPPAIPYPH